MNSILFGIVFIFIIISAGCTTQNITIQNTPIILANATALTQAVMNYTVNIISEIPQKIIPKTINTDKVRNYTKTISQGSFAFIPLNISGELNISVNTSRPSEIYVVNNTLKQLYYAITQEQPLYYMQPILKAENRGCTEKSNQIKCNIRKNYNKIGLLIINDGIGNNQANISIITYTSKRGIINIKGNKNTVNHRLRDIWYNYYKMIGTKAYHIYYIQYNYIQYPLYRNLDNELNNLPKYELFNADADNPRRVKYIFNQLTNKKIKNQQRAITFLVNEIEATTPDKNTQAQIAASMASHIIYDTNVDMNSYTERYPYQVLYDNLGICQSQAILSTYLLKELGFNAGVFVFGDISHVTSALKVSQNDSYRGTGYTIVGSEARVPIGSTPFIKGLAQYPVTYPIQLSNGIDYTGNLYNGYNGDEK